MSKYDDEVSKLERDLRFFPVSNNNPKRLAVEQINFFNEKGYLSGFRIFDENSVNNNRNNFDNILQKFIDAGKNSYAIDRYQDRIPEIWDIARYPVIVDYITDLLGNNVVCWATHYFCKLPKDGKGVSWHQDCSYWPLTPSKTITVWLAIDDADAENGCMRVIPGSHLNGHLKFRESDPYESNVLSQTVDNAESYGDSPVNIELRAGEISLHSDLLLHGSLPNFSNRRRCGLTLRYCPMDVRAYWNWNQHSIIVSGRDPENHWADVPRPENEFAFREEA